MKRGRNSNWEGGQWIVAQEKEGNRRGKNRDKKIVMVKIIIQKLKNQAMTKSSAFSVIVLDLFLWLLVLILVLGTLSFLGKGAAASLVGQLSVEKT
jgi:hypothetical protein